MYFSSRKTFGKAGKPFDFAQLSLAARKRQNLPGHEPVTCRKTNGSNI
jgi:hypothetical protein